MATEKNLEVQLTDTMQQFALGQVTSGSYSDISEVIRAGMRLLMEREGAQAFYALKNELESAVTDAENGAFTDFNVKAYEPAAFVR